MFRVASSKVAFRAIAAASSKTLLSNSFANPRPLRRFSVQANKANLNLISDSLIRSQLVKALNCRIKTSQFISSRPAPPPDFPFKIQDDLQHQPTLTRMLDGEEIEIRLLDVDDDNQEHDYYDFDDDINTIDGDSGSGSDSDKSPAQKCVPLEAEITKPNGKSLKFAATASADEIVIQKLTAKDADNNVICSEIHINELQMGFRKFLEMRGIKKSIADFLYDYMSWISKLPHDIDIVERIEEAGKSDQQNVETLKKLKKVIKNW